MWILISFILLILTLFVWQWLAVVWLVLIFAFNVGILVSKIWIVCRKNPRGIIFGIIAVFPNIIWSIITFAILAWAMS